MTEALNALKALTDKIADTEKEIAKEGKNLFTEAIKDIFAKHPTLLYITWTQGTPSFNDGNPCRFSIHEVNGRCNTWPKNDEGDDVEKSDISNYGYDYDNIDKEGTPELKEDFNKFADIISSLGELICTVIQEENASVFIDRNGISVDYYDMG